MRRMSTGQVMAVVVVAVAGAAWAGEGAGPGLPPQPGPLGTGNHTGDVFGQSPEWDRQFAAEALEIFKGLKPDPAWVAQLKALPDNTWLQCRPTGPQEPEQWRSEVPMVYVPDYHACLFIAGCTSPGYSSDTWMYHTGANRWVQMWPNYCKGGPGQKRNQGPYPMDRPATRCSLGLAYDGDRQRVVCHGGANAGAMALITWEYDPATNTWSEAAPGHAGAPRMADNCLGFAPGFGVVEVALGATWVFRPEAKKWEKLTTQGQPPGAGNSRLVWAAKQNRLIYWARTALWAFDPKTLAWENISPKEGPSPAGFYRQGIAYDAANDVVIMYGTKDESGKLSMGPWVYSFASKTWTDMQPAKGPPKGAGQQMLACYDAEYNVLVITGSGRGTWVYRYKTPADLKTRRMP